MSYRLRTREINEAQFVRAESNETGAMPVISRRGEFKPIKVQSQSQILQICGNPSALYPSVFEALAFVKSAPLWIVPVIGADAVYSGVDIKRFSITSEAVGTGDASETIFTKTLVNKGIDNGSLVISKEGIDQNVTEDNGVITASGLSGTLNKQTGELLITFDTAPASLDAITADYNYSKVAPFTFGKDYDTFSFDTFEDKILNENIGTGDGSLINFTDTLVNKPIKAGTLVLKLNGVNQEVSESAGTLTGATISAGTIDLTSGAIDVTFNTAPDTGYNITVDYVYTRDATDISFSIFAKSQHDAQLAISVENITEKQYNINVYDILSTGNSLKKSYTFSLINEKDGLSRSLFYTDVFSSDFDDIKIKVNSDYVDPPVAPDTTNQVSMFGGSRGDVAQASDFQTAWQYFRKPNKYKAYIFMDAIGGYSTHVNEITSTYQTQGYGLTVVPFGNDAEKAVTYRQSTGIDSDQMSIFTNWAKIEDTYNNSVAYISNIGSIGRKMALTSALYDQPSSAGYDLDGLGGQLQDWSVKDIENDYTDLATGGDLYNLDNAQVNPVILTEEGNLLVWGDKTMIQRNTDTSFSGHRRLLNRITETIKEQILRFKIFKNISDTSLNNLRIQTQTFLDQVVASGSINDALASTSKNTLTTQDERKMILSIYIQATPNAQFVELLITRVGQQVTVQESAGA